MGRRKIADRNTRKLQRSGGGSVIVSLPIDIIRKLKWRAKQKVVFKLKGKNIIISDWKK